MAQARSNMIFLKRLQVFNRIICAVLNAAAACPVFDRRSSRSHYLQPPAQLRFTLSLRALQRASVQLWCCDNKQRAQLLCICCPLPSL